MKRKRLNVLSVGLSALALTASTLAIATLPGGALTPGLPSTAEVPKGDLDHRPAQGDAGSALALAHEAEMAVEDLSQRTQDTRIFANPDGTWTSETTSGPEQVQDGKRLDDGSRGWNRIDANLRKTDDGYAPRHSTLGITISGGETEWFARVSRNGHELAYAFDGPLATKLPPPSIDGNTAIYNDVFDGIVDGLDLVVRVSGTGFSHWLVLTKQPTDSELDLGTAPGLVDTRGLR